MSTSVCGTAIRLLDMGLWPIPIVPGSKAPIADATAPKGEQWGVVPWTERDLRDLYDFTPGAGLGLLLGPAGTIVDLECDGPEGLDSLASLLGGEIVETLGWSSTRGPHHIFRYDPRMGRYPSIVKHASLPGLEIRLGSTGKALQSNCPPTLGTDGEPRRWNGCRDVASLPEAFYERLDAITAKPGRTPAATSAVRPDATGTPLERYVSQAVESECEKAATALDGNRNATLNAASFALGTLVGAGALPRIEAERRLLDAAAGYVSTDGEHAAVATIRSGLDAGEREPRDLSRVGAKRPAESISPIKPINGRSHENEPKEWGPLRIGEPPSVEPFPCDVFPPPLEAFCRSAAESLNAPVDFVGLSMLTTAGAAIGQSVNLRVKGSWHEAPLLYAILIAPPGKVKTPASRAATRPLIDIDNCLRDDSKLVREHWEEAKKAHAKNENAPPPGPEPPQRRAVVKDITRESLCLVLHDNPRGVLCAPDEATAWIGSWNQYRAKGGTDEQFWLSLYSGDPVSVDRKGGRESVNVRHPFCAVLGSIQPDLLASLRDDRGRDNGFLDRLVFSYPDVFPPRVWNETEINVATARDWAEAIDRLRAVEMRTVDDHPRPRLAEFTPEAKARFVQWYNTNGRAMDEPDARSGALSKGEARCARLALILSRLRLACDPCQALQDADGAPPVAAADVEGAIRLDAYFATHLERALYGMSRGAGDSDALALLDWLKRHRLTEFREADVTADLRRFRGDPAGLGDALTGLTRLGAIRPKPETVQPGKRGPKPSPAHEVNPDLLGAPGITANPGNSPSEPTCEPISGNSGNSRRSTVYSTPDGEREVFEL